MEGELKPVPVSEIIDLAREICRAVSGMPSAQLQAALLVSYLQVAGAAEKWFSDPERINRILVAAQRASIKFAEIVDEVNDISPAQLRAEITNDMPLGGKVKTH